MRLTIKQKILGGFGIVLLLMVIMGGVSFYFIGEIENFNSKAENSTAEKINVLEREIDHLEWVNSLADVILHQEDFSGELDHTQCAFGKTYYQLLDTEEFKKMPSEIQKTLKDIEQPHKELHQSAKKIIEIKENQGIQNGQGYQLALEIYNNQTHESLKKVQSNFNQYQNYLTTEQERNLNIAKTKVNLAQKVILISTIIAIIIGLGIALLINKRISGPINKAVNFADEIASGNLTIEAIEVKSNDEVSDLVTALTQMQDKLKKIITNLLDKTEDLSAYSQQLSAAAEEGNASIDTTKHLIEKMASSIQQISASTEEVAGFAQEANAQTETGDKNIQDTITNVNNINQLVSKAVNAIDDLDNNSEEIENIINLINSIAEQTNLLALNAAIEAARAGEHGQGFAVVADEIRELAQETSQATDKIANLIDKTQSKTKVGLKAIREVEEKAQTGQTIAENTGEVFAEIKNASGETSAQIEETAHASQTLVKDTDEVMNAAEDIDTMSEEVSESAQELATMSQELQEEVAYFKI
ncbi:methyl-accepting chemotaxis protein [Halanaerobacter jeridensis]|uniref:Methyl-accepting chemotaxis protein n=1 Tax=Halanaerobacter jeridensis TaxID=706427 RepID=A0A938XU27_9FIRM|nr:methyl-accepting chemotaxis protein [Halanaerobacter jeridensis]MBM7556331.1 methyl-accepting chemotaxis protein [Halanaerobacter jeridensis]